MAERRRLQYIIMWQKECGRENVATERRRVAERRRLQDLHVWQRQGCCVEPDDNSEEPPYSNAGP